MVDEARRVALARGVDESFVVKANYVVLPGGKFKQGRREEAWEMRYRRSCLAVASTISRRGTKSS